MSPNTRIRSHRKPSRPAMQSWAVRTGVAGGVLSTLAVAAPGSATAAEKPAESTMEMPTFDVGLSASIAQSADATQQAAAGYQARAQVDDAIEQARNDARKAAKKAREEAERKAEAERKSAEAEKKRDQEHEQEQEQKQSEDNAQSHGSRSADRSRPAGSGSTAKPTPPSSSSDSSSSATGSAAAMLAFLKSQVGKAYVMGGTGASGSYDCSGLVMAAYKQIGIDLPRVSGQQSTAGRQVSLDSLKPGDILYWGSAGSAYHVAVYTGGGKFIGAQNPRTGVVERDMKWDMPTGAVRVL
ncbi:C40 family peptidase [Streptomyces morookaense]|uniref:C40 family peptidase n=1 Tax=Streptomyces morookaense TaxID=1970 RepID=A0A7Y7E563_STRMO|nr:C40 family peptidase [Streptomyces morookaense]NVK76380.1 C40 family peptidase [Streptomyces morookaense]